METKNIFERVKDALTNNTVTVVKAAKESLSVPRLFSPVFREVPPLWSSQKILSDGIQGWAFAAISAIADEICTNPIELYKKRGKDWVLSDDHDVLDMIHNPNPFQTKEQFMWLTAAYLLSVGECFWVLDRAKNPTQMITYNPVKVKLIFSDSDLIDSYELRLSDGALLKIPADQVIFLTLPDLKNPLRGSGILNSVPQAVDSDEFTQEYLRTFFYNNATPGGVLETEQDSITEAGGKQIIKSFEARHLGKKKQHRIALLTHGLKYKTTDSTIKDLDTGTIDAGIRDRILGAFRVPKSILGITEDVNRANAEAANFSFAKRAILPKLLMIESQINQRLIPKFNDGRNLYLEFENPVTDDQYIEAQTREINIRSGVRTANEYRQQDGLTDLEQSGTVQQTEAKQKAITKRINRKKSFSITDKTMLNYDNEILKAATKIVMAKRDARKAKIKALEDAGQKVFKGPFTEEMTNDYHEKKIDAVKQTEEAFSKALKKYYDNLYKKLVKPLNGKTYRSKASLTIDYDEEEEADVLMALSSPFIEKSLLAQAALSSALLEIDNTLDSQDERTKKFISEWSVKLGKTSSATTNDFVQKTLEEWGNTEGATVADLRETLKVYFEDGKKADMIARTEVSRATGYAQQTVYSDAGAVGKKWVTAADERVCPFCEEIDGTIVEIDKSFIDEGDSFVGNNGSVLEANYGDVVSAPLHPSCRCDLLPVFDSEKMIEGMQFKKLQKGLLEVVNKEKSLKELEAELKAKQEELEEAKIKHQQEVEEDLKALQELDESKTA